MSVHRSRVILALEKRTTLIIGVCACASFLFFFLAPVVWMDIIPCVPQGYGYSSFSRALFNIGEGYMNGHLFWMTENYANCI